MNSVTLAIVISVTVEAVIEYAKTIFNSLQTKKYENLTFYFLSFFLSTLLCFYVGADIYTALGLAKIPAWLGTLLTGLFASRGSSYLRGILLSLTEKPIL